MVCLVERFCEEADEPRAREQRAEVADGDSIWTKVQKSQKVLSERMVAGVLLMDLLGLSWHRLGFGEEEIV